MSFSDTYKEEVLQSRRTRSQRAGFWAKVVSFVLMIMVAATLRSEPELRQAVVAAGTDTVLKVTGRDAQTATSFSPSARLGQGTQQSSPAILDALSKQIEGVSKVGQIEPFVKPQENRIKVNRGGQLNGNGPRFTSVLPRDASGDMQGTSPQSPSPQSPDAAEAANALGRMLKDFNIGQ